jgi:hypothetical protein
MNVRYFVVVASIATVMLVTSPAFSGPQGESKTSGEKGRKSSLKTSNSNTVYRTIKTNANMFHFEERLKHTFAQAEKKDPAALPSVEKIKGEKEELGREQIAELISNPLSYLWFGIIQNDTSWWNGKILDTLNESSKVNNTTIIQPVMSMQVTEKWKMIFRPVIPINSFRTIKGFNIPEAEPTGTSTSTTADFDRETGLGDIVLWTAFTNHYKPPFVYGFGPTVMMDTASDKSLGTGKWSAGPMGMATYIGEKWILGAIAQHWWSFAGDNDRNSVSLTDFQYIIRYRLTKETNIGMAPNVQYNWDASSGERLRLPVGIGADTLVYLGPFPVKIGLEYHYYLEQPDAYGPQHLLRFVFAPVVPAPAWSRKPLFGK